MFIHPCLFMSSPSESFLCNINLQFVCYSNFSRTRFAQNANAEFGITAVAFSRVHFAILLSVKMINSNIKLPVR